MKKLDLHGVRHEDARKQTIRFVEDHWGSNTNVQIVTGHSAAMRSIVTEILDLYAVPYFVGGFLGVDPATITVEID